MAKLFATEALTRQSADFVDMLGPDGIRSEGDQQRRRARDRRVPVPVRAGNHDLRGDSEVQRNIIAQRGLGLPRA